MKLDFERETEEKVKMLFIFLIDRHVKLPFLNKVYVSYEIMKFFIRFECGLIKYILNQGYDYN